MENKTQIQLEKLLQALVKHDTKEIDDIYEHVQTIDLAQEIEENLQKTMLSKEVLPHIVVVEDILKYMNLGLLELGHEFLRGGRNNGKIY